MARVFQPDFTGPKVGSTEPCRVLLPAPAGAIASSGSGLTFGWRIVLLPKPAAVSTSVEALRREIISTATSGDYAKAAPTQHVVLVLPTTINPTAGCGDETSVDDWGNEVSARLD